MNKQETIKAISKKTGKTLNDVTEVIKGLEEVVTESLAQGEKVQLTGFVTFKPIVRKARKGFDPRKMESIDIPAAVAIKATVGEKLGAVAKQLDIEAIEA